MTRHINGHFYKPVLFVEDQEVVDYVEKVDREGNVTREKTEKPHPLNPGHTIMRVDMVCANPGCRSHIRGSAWDFLENPNDQCSGAKVKPEATEEPPLPPAPKPPSLEELIMKRLDEMEKRLPPKDAAQVPPG